MQVLRGEYESMKRYLRFRNSSLRVLRAGFNGNDVIVNAIRRGNRNIRFARLFFPFSLPLSLAKAKRNVVISVDVALPVEREGRDEEETSVDGRVVRRQGCEATSLRFTRYGSGKCRER